MISELACRQAVEEYLQLAADGNGRAGVRVALDLLDRGVAGDDVIVDVLGAAQREVGKRWAQNKWTIADEHLISGVTQKALDAVANSLSPVDEHGRVVVACAVGDWHSLPAQMFAEVVRARGFAVAFLGASTPVDHVASYLRRHRPDALAVSCATPLFFAGVARLADAAHAQGIPAIVGGGALGHGPERARRLGADAWAKDVDAGVTVLRAWQHQVPEISSAPMELDPVALRLEAGADEIGKAAFEALAAAYRPMTSLSDEQLARTQEDLVFITRFAAAARLVDDATVLTDMLEWLRALLASRGVPAMAVDAGLAVLAPPISRIDAQSGRLVRDAMRPGGVHDIP